MADIEPPIPGPLWLYIYDTEGLAHIVGDVSGAADFTECGREFATAPGRGWYGSREQPLVVCGFCVTAYMLPHFSEVLYTTTSSVESIVLSDIDFTSNRIEGNTVGPVTGSPE